MCPTIKLSYFDFSGRGEPARVALAIGDIPFEDDRISFCDWKQVKPTTPFGSIPVITVDGQVSSQSGAVLRYAGKLANIYPTCPSSALVVDEIVDVMADFVNCLFRYSGDDKDLLREDRTKAVEVDIPRLVGGIEKRISQVGRDGPWAVGDSITIADLAIANVVRNCKQGIFEHIPENVFDKYERFMKSYEAVYEHPKVAAYYEKMNAGK